jgi:hypothetical protein
VATNMIVYARYLLVLKNTPSPLIILERIGICKLATSLDAFRK